MVVFGTVSVGGGTPVQFLGGFNDWRATKFVFIEEMGSLRGDIYFDLLL